MIYTNQIKYLRTKLHLTQEEFANITSMPLSTVKKLEQPARLSENIRLETINRITNRVGVSQEWLMQLFSTDFSELDSNQEALSETEQSTIVQYENIKNIFNIINLTKLINDPYDTTTFKDNFNITILKTSEELLISKALATLRSITTDQLPLIYNLKIETYSPGYIQPRMDEYCYISPNTNDKNKLASTSILYLLQYLQGDVVFSTELFNARHFTEHYYTANDLTRKTLLAELQRNTQIPSQVIDTFSNICRDTCPEQIGTNTELTDILNSMYLMKFDSIDVLDKLHNNVSGTKAHIDIYLSI